MFIIKYLVLPILLFAQVGCNSNPADLTDIEECNHAASDEFVPLTLGTYWVYDYFLFNDDTVSDTEVKKIYIKDTLTYTVITQKYNLSGLAELYSSTNFVESDYINYYQNKSDGLYKAGFIFDSNKVIIEPALLYKYPANVGDNWLVKNMSLASTQDRIIYLNTVKYECVAKDVVFITPFDTFSTIVYGYSYKQAPDVLSYWHYFDYFTSGVGRVGTEVYSSPDSTINYEERMNFYLQIKDQLTDYCITVY
jgi:hypothetical protein